jgi:AraC-like DNA-binding protein
MGPLQYQKQIRLQEARRLMLGEGMDVASASFRVGYEDPSYFSRKYKKLFGAPPQRDIAKLRNYLSVKVFNYPAECDVEEHRRLPFDNRSLCPAISVSG